MPKKPSPAEVALAKFMDGPLAKKYSTLKLVTEREHEVITTGSPSLDYALGTGGWVRGRCVEVWGPDGTGKTTLGLISMAQAQRKFPDKPVVFFDIEAKLDLDWAQRLGVDTSRMLLAQPDSAEDVADLAKDVLRGISPSFMIFDSIGALLTQEEMDKDAKDVVVGTPAKMITRMVKIASNLAKHERTVVYLVNQVRANLGYGAETTTGGGFALKHVTTHRLKLRKAPGAALTVPGSDEQAAYKMVAKVEKNGVSSPNRAAEITIVTSPTEKYGMQVGIANFAKAAFDVGKASGAIGRRNGGYYLLPGMTEELRGEDACVAELEKRPELVEELSKAAIASLSPEAREIVPLPLLEAVEEAS